MRLVRIPESWLVIRHKTRPGRAEGRSRPQRKSGSPRNSVPCPGLPPARTTPSIRHRSVGDCAGDAGRTPAPPCRGPGPPAATSSGRKDRGCYVGWAAFFIWQIENSPNAVVPSEAGPERHIAPSMHLCRLGPILLVEHWQLSDPGSRSRAPRPFRRMCATGRRDIGGDFG